MKIVKLHLRIYTLALMLCLSMSTSIFAGSDFIAIAYHDVVVHRDELTFDAVTLDTLIDHFEWLKVNGYHPVSIDDLEADRAGIKPLPDKAILLCWDDAYTSFYTHVFPLLKTYNFPAVLALVGSWMEPEPEEMVQYGSKLVQRNTFMTWAQVENVAASGLVEIASHSNNLHTTILANPSGGTLPAATAHRFDPITAKYETDSEYRGRIQNDLQASSDLILKHLGKRPRVMVWPFGRYNTDTVEIAAKMSMPFTLTLNPVPSNTGSLQTIGRIYPSHNPPLSVFRSYLEKQIRPSVQHFFRIDSHDLLEPSAGIEHHFNTFLDRVKDLDPNLVILDPIVEENGRSRALFVNNRFPIIQDRLSRLTWHTSKRAGAEVVLWLSSSLFTTEDGENQETINRFFSDMGKSAPGKGLVVDTPELIQALIQDVEPDSYQETNVLYWNPDKQRLARKEAMSKVEAKPQVLKVFQALEAFQEWQPFQEVGLVLSMENFLSLELHQYNILLRYFDFLIVDVGKNNIQILSGRTGKSQLELLQKEKYLQKCSFLFSIDDQGSALTEKLQLLPTLDIINWGYQFDRFLEGSPSPGFVRKLLSKRDFPYPLRQ